MARSSVPLPKILMRTSSDLMRPARLRDLAFTSLPPSKMARRPTFTVSVSTAKMFLKPRLGRRRWSGIWPPSKPGAWWKPERDLAPLLPRVAVLPWPEPGPRPTRLGFFLEPLAGFSSERNMGPPSLRFLGDLDQVLDRENHAADLGAVGVATLPVEFAQP